MHRGSQKRVRSGLRLITLVRSHNMIAAAPRTLRQLPIPGGNVLVYAQLAKPIQSIIETLFGISRSKCFA